VLYPKKALKPFLDFIIKMSCDLCNLIIGEDEATAETPCCDRSVHTQCLIDTIASNSRHYHDSICVCGGFLHANSDNYDLDNQANTAAERVKFEDLKKQPLAVKAFKVLKQSVITRNKCKKAFISKLNEKAGEFKEQVSAGINIIKNIKKDAIDALKSSEEHKNYSSSMSRVTYYSSRFKRMFNVNDRELNAVLSLGRRSRWYGWRCAPNNLIRWKFRIRIN